MYGAVQRSGDHCNFPFHNLVNRSLALMEEPKITPLTVNDFKELLGGNPFDIHVKHQRDVRLPRMPVLSTTNNDLTQYLSGRDIEAIKERCITYTFDEKVGGEKLPRPPCHLCTCHFANWYKKYYHY